MKTLEHPQSIRTVFLDVGFTLLAPHPSVIDIALTTLAPQGFTPDAAALEARLTEAETTLRRLASEDRALWSDDRAIRDLWIAYFSALLAPTLAHLPEGKRGAMIGLVVDAFDSATSYRLYPDVEPSLSVMGAYGLKLGVISDWGTSLGLILRHHDLVRHFDYAVISAAVRLSKPDPALFHTALTRANAIPDYSIHVGDAYTLDVIGARAAGIIPVLLDRNHRYDAVTLDCLVVHDLYGLLDLLELPRP